jgi:hypothetical protein
VLDESSPVNLISMCSGIPMGPGGRLSSYGEADTRTASQSSGSPCVSMMTLSGSKSQATGSAGPTGSWTSAPAVAGCASLGLLASAVGASAADDDSSDGAVGGAVVLLHPASRMPHAITAARPYADRMLFTGLSSLTCWGMVDSQGRAFARGKNLRT